MTRRRTGHTTAIDGLREAIAGMRRQIRAAPGKDAGALSIRIAALSQTLMDEEARMRAEAPVSLAYARSIAMDDHFNTLIEERARDRIMLIFREEDWMRHPLIQEALAAGEAHRKDIAKLMAWANDEPWPE